MIRTSNGEFSWMPQPADQSGSWPILVFDSVDQPNDVLTAMYAILDFCRRRGWIHASVKPWGDRLYVAANFNDYQEGTAQDLLREIADFVERRILAERIRAT